MIESRLEIGLRALAWLAVLATVLVLLAMGVLTVRPAAAGSDGTVTSFEEEMNAMPLEEMER